MNTEFGAQLRAKRKAAGLTRRDVAEKVVRRDGVWPAPLICPDEKRVSVLLGVCCAVALAGIVAVLIGTFNG